MGRLDTALDGPGGLVHERADQSERPLENLSRIGRDGELRFRPDRDRSQVHFEDIDLDPERGQVGDGAETGSDLRGGPDRGLRLDDRPRDGGADDQDGEGQPVRPEGSEVGRPEAHEPEPGFR